MSVSKSKKARYAMTMDTRACVACNSCVLACKTENNVAEGYCRDWIEQEVRGYFPDLSMENRSLRCMHCTNSPCVGACPTGASHFGEGGLVAVSRNKCTGCKACVASCPYDARYVHPEGYVDKCTFCAHRTLEGGIPACVETCPTSALCFGDMNDPKSEISQLLRKRKHRVLKQQAGTKPHLYFLS